MATKTSSLASSHLALPYVDAELTGPDVANGSIRFQLDEVKRMFPAISYGDRTGSMIGTLVRFRLGSAGGEVRETDFRRMGQRASPRRGFSAWLKHEGAKAGVRVRLSRLSGGEALLTLEY